jgi:cytochrome c oxidase assembly protein subunit 11
MFAGLNPNQKTVLQCVGAVVFMGSMAWASVPLYALFCQVTGYGGTTNVAEAESEIILDRTMVIRFDASLASDMPWEFRPMQTEMVLRIGETGMAFYEAYNPTDRPIAGTASYNVAPFDAGLYFSKIACFCFEQQVLQPGERVEMPVIFYVDPALVDDPEATQTPAITLSYTFHVTDIPEDYAALSSDND